MKATRPQPKKSISDFVSELRNAIVSGSLLPNERLIEVDLANSLKTNRANIRTALALLEREGLVVREPNRGARVRLISDKEALEIAEARQALEALVARLAAERATAADCNKLLKFIDQMENAHKDGDLKEFSSLNGKLHATIRQIGGNETITKMLENLRFHFVRIQYRALFMPGRAEKSFEEHRNIVEAICARDPDRAEAAMRDHLENIKESIRWFTSVTFKDAHAVV